MSDNEDNNLLEMNDGYETNESCLPNNITEKTKQLYERTYIHFTEWQKKNNMSTISENVLLAYFKDMSKIYSPPTLFGKFSMLKSTLNVFMNTDISNYSKLRKFLKQRSVGYTAKKSKIFTPSDISNFIENAPDEVYLLMKTAVIFGVMGACQRQELHGLLFENVTDSKGSILVNIMKNATDFDRSFTITGKYYHIVKKYMNMRPKRCQNKHFFLKYCTYKDKCTSQNLGINTFGNMGKVVATYLKLDNPELYTGHCFRRTSATVLIGSGGDIMPLQSPCLISKSITMAIRNSMQNKLHESSSPCNSKNRGSPRSDVCSGDSSSVPDFPILTDLNETPCILAECPQHKPS